MKRLLRGKTVEELVEKLIPVSRNQFSIRRYWKQSRQTEPLQAAGIDIDFQKANQHHLRNAEKKTEYQMAKVQENCD